MCAQIKEKEKVKEKYSKARGWRVREIDTDIDGERLGKGKVWQVRKRWWEDKGGKGGGRVCATWERNIWSGGRQDSSWRRGLRARVLRGKQNREQEAESRRQRSRANDRQWEQQRERERENRRKEKKKYKLPTPYLLFSIKLIFSNGSRRSRLGGTSIPITMLPTHTAQWQAEQERKKRGGPQV